MTVVTRFDFPEGLKGGPVTPSETALATLREHCTPAQQATLDLDRRFEAVGPSGKRYAIWLTDDAVSVGWQSTRHGQSWRALVKGRAMRLPVGDLALLAKLSIESAEDLWLVAGHACGTVWVEDRAPAAFAQQQVLGGFYQHNQLLQHKQLLAVGTVYTDMFGARFEWNGQAWARIA